MPIKRRMTNELTPGEKVTDVHYRIYSVTLTFHKKQVFKTLTDDEKAALKPGEMPPFTEVDEPKAIIHLRSWVDNDARRQLGAEYAHGSADITVEGSELLNLIPQSVLYDYVKKQEGWTDCEDYA